jgi:hypothetical protein
MAPLELCFGGIVFLFGWMAPSNILFKDENFLKLGLRIFEKRPKGATKILEQNNKDYNIYIGLKNYKILEQNNKGYNIYFHYIRGVFTKMLYVSRRLTR